MTCHIAMRCPEGTVIFCDSQASTHESEFHGAEKLFAGSDFIVGGAGNGWIVQHLFDHLAANSSINASTIESEVNAYFESEVRQEFLKTVTLLVVTGDRILQSDPGMFRNMRDRGAFASIGSGASFVAKAMQRDASVGLHRSTQNLVDVFTLLQDLSEAANESLTVNDKILAGFIAGNAPRSYLLGDASIRPLHASSVARQSWLHIAEKFAEILAQTRTINGEIRTAATFFSSITTGAMNDAVAMMLALHNASVSLNRLGLENKINQYMAFYDQLLGRNVAPSAPLL